MPVLLKKQTLTNQAAPCYSKGLLQRLGLDLQSLASETQSVLKEDDACLPLSQLQVPSSEALDFGALRLDLVIAQQARTANPMVTFPQTSGTAG